MCELGTSCEPWRPISRNAGCFVYIDQLIPIPTGRELTFISSTSVLVGAASGSQATACYSLNDWLAGDDDQDSVSQFPVHFRWREEWLPQGNSIPPIDSLI